MALLANTNNYLVRIILNPITALEINYKSTTQTFST